MSWRALRAMQDGYLASMTMDERKRFLAGRGDWRDDDWEDHCGDGRCKLCCGEIPSATPRTLLESTRLDGDQP